MSITKKLILTAAITFTIAATSVSAQTPHQNVGSSFKTHRIHHGYHANYGGHGYQGYRGGYRGYYVRGNGVGLGFALHGAADVIRSRAEANLTNAQAASQREVVRTQRLENDVFALETRLERRRINSDSRFGHLHARAAAAAEMSLASTTAEGVATAGTAHDPNRLAIHELEPQTGRLAWPLILAMSHFEEVRGPIDQVFAARAEAGSLHPDDYLPLLDLIDDVMNDIYANAAIFPKRDVATAHDFLRRMKAEARLPALQSPSATQLVSR